jgi:hypothetical protein
LHDDEELEEGDSIASYEVALGERLVLLTGNDDEDAKMIWRDVAALMPDELSDKYIKEFKLFSASEDTTIAFVNLMPEGEGFSFSVNKPVYFSLDKKERKTTLIHEISHILSLNSENMKKTENCETLELDEGCFDKNAFGYVFINQFWGKEKTKSYNL